MIDTAPVYLQIGETSEPLMIGHLVRHEGETVPAAIACFLRALADEFERTPPV